ncbi:MAG: ABC transporter ATP-binding protein [Halanaerobiales bacterium]
MSILKVKNLKAYYISQKYGRVNKVRAVDDVSFQVNKNEIYGIAGESGCGKSTFLKAVNGLSKAPLQILEGEVLYEFENRKLDILALKQEKQRRKVRGAAISNVPQGSMSVLNPVRRIEKSFRDFIGAHRKIEEKKEFENMVREHLHALGLEWDVMKAFPHQLSGGMRQRVTIALATILRPEIVFADEPTTALDVVVQRGVVQLIKKIKEEQKNTVIMVTHDMAIHANLCDRMAIMYAGKIVEEGEVDTIFNEALHPYTRLLLESLPVMGDKSPRLSAPGSPPSLINVPPGCRFHPRCKEATDRCKQEVPSLIQVGEGHRVACFKEEVEYGNSSAETRA